MFVSKNTYIMHVLDSMNSKQVYSLVFQVFLI